MTRGIKHDVDRFINELSSKYLPTKWFNPLKSGKGWGKKKRDVMLQVGVRPIQFWEIVYPEPWRDSVLNTIFFGQTKETQHKRHNKFLMIIRKILGIKKIGDWKKDAEIIPLYKGAVEFIKVGEKPDRYQDGVEMI